MIRCSLDSDFFMNCATNFLYRYREILGEEQVKHKLPTAVIHLCHVGFLRHNLRQLPPPKKAALPLLLMSRPLTLRLLVFARGAAASAAAVLHQTDRQPAEPSRKATQKLLFFTTSFRGLGFKV